LIETKSLNQEQLIQYKNLREKAERIAKEEFAKQLEARFYRLVSFCY
jgi:hypothetical protein